MEPHLTATSVIWSPCCSFCLSARQNKNGSLVFCILSNFSCSLLILRCRSSYSLVLKLAFLPYFTMFPVKKEPNPSPWGRSWEQDKSSRAAWSAVFRENVKWWTKIYTRLTWVSRVKKVIQQFYRHITFFGFNWGQSYLATLVTPQNCTKILRNLTFVVQFSYFIIRPKKNFVFSSNFWATFVTKSNF